MTFGLIVPKGESRVLVINGDDSSKTRPEARHRAVCSAGVIHCHAAIKALNPRPWNLGGKL